ncbi:MAG: kynureninase [Proteobacteria bacterium]|nr:kynureninase [Pseudomonadota bacterium]
MKPTLEYARACDEADELRSFRDEFAVPTNAAGQQQLYLCGHSLGLMPRAARRLVDQELDDWARFAVLGHESATRPWIPYHQNLAKGLAYLTGAQPDEVVAMNSLTVNLHLMLASFYRPQGRRVKILMEAGAFSSDRHAVASQLAWHRQNLDTALVELTPEPGAESIAEAQVEAYLERHGAEVALVLWPGVQFRTGQAFDLQRIIRAARRAGCIAGVDLAHSIGNMPLALHEHDADFAVWCSYKYLNAGPGAIGGCFVHERNIGAAPASRLHGWWGHEAATRFRMEPRFEAESGAAAWQISNPPILAAAPLIASLELFQAARAERLRAKSIALTGFLEQLLQPLQSSVQLITPRAVESRGCQLSIRILGGGSRGKRVLDRLTELDVICDWREPDVIRVAPVPLYNRFEEVFRFAAHLTQVLQEIS